MCGIAGLHLKDPDYVKNTDAMECMVDELLLGIENRGKHATGLVAVTRGAEGSYGSAVMQKDAVPATNFIKTRKRLPADTRTVLLHTRWWTQGNPEKPFNNHPVVHGSCFAVHNGAISNDDELFKKHKLNRTAEVDSEAIPAMLHILGWNKLREALEELDGSFAIAAIDPIMQPGKLLLAKGSSSPLVVVENEKFLIWASLEYAIRDAWGKVLGTPPKRAAFRHVNTGEAMLFDGGSKEEFRFDAFKHVHSAPWKPWSSDDDRGQTTCAIEPAKREARGVVEDRVIACSNLRATGLGKARLRALRDNYDQDDLPDFEGVIRWVHCSSCSEKVLVKDMVVLDGEGTVCVDCKGLAEGKGQAEVYPGVSAVLSGERWDELDKMARLTEQIHEIVTSSVVRKSGLARHIVDYLLWHADDDMLNMDQNKDLLDLCGELAQMYQDEIKVAWDDYAKVGRPTPAEAATETTKQHEMCRLHGIPTSDTEKCWKCLNKGIADAPLVTVDDIEKCPECDKFMNSHIGCIPCQREESEARDNIPPHRTPDQRVSDLVELAIEASDEEARKTRCNRCIRAATVFINDGKLARYCSLCYNTCSVCCHVDHAEPAEQRTPNHICRDKMRVCHRHARGKEGVIADGQIARMGFEIAFTADYDEGAVRSAPPVVI